MANELDALSELAGFIGACVADSDSGMMMSSVGGTAKLDLEVASAVATEVVKATRDGGDGLGINDAIDDILITMGTVYHLMRPLPSNPKVFIYLALTKKSANLAMARIKLTSVSADVKV